MLIIYYRIEQNTNDCGSQQLPASLVHFRKPCPVFRTLGDIGLHLTAGELPAFGAKSYAFFTAADTCFADSCLSGVENLRARYFFICSSSRSEAMYTGHSPHIIPQQDIISISINLSFGTFGIFSGECPGHCRFIYCSTAELFCQPGQPHKKSGSPKCSAA